MKLTRPIVVLIVIGVAAGCGTHPKLPCRPVSLPPPELTCPVSDEVREVAVSDDGTRIVVVEFGCARMYEGTRRRWVYKPPRKLHGMPAVIGRAHPISVRITVAELLLAQPPNRGVDELVLVGLGRKGRVQWRRNGFGEYSLVQPWGCAILASDECYDKCGREVLVSELLSPRTGRVLWRTNGVYGESVVFSPDGGYAALTNPNIDGRTTIMRRSGRVIWRARLARSRAHIEVQELAVSNGARKTVVVGMEALSPERKPVLACFDRRGQELWRKPMSASRVLVDCDAKRILVAEHTSNSTCVRLLNSSGKVIWQSPTELGKWDADADLWISPDGKSVLFALVKGGSRTLCLVDANGRILKWAAVPREGRIEFAAKGSRLIIYGDKSFRVFRNPLFAGR